MNPSARWLARWRRSRSGPEHQRSLQLAMAHLATAGAWSASRTAPSPEWEWAHTLARNQPLVHARLHARLLWPRLRDVGTGDAARELERCAMAPIASLLRRAAGYRSEEPSGSSLRDTWNKRPSVRPDQSQQTQPESPPKWANMGAK